MTQKLVVNNLTQQAYDLLRTKIITKEILPGTRLVDSTLAQQYGISRTPMRDAIRKLAEEGLVTPSSTKGYFVYKPTLKDIEEIFEIREMIDIAVTTKVITKILPQNPAALEKITQSYLKGLNTPACSTDFIQSDEDFHASIISLSDNSRLIEYYSELRYQTKNFRLQTSKNTEKIQQANNYHEKIYEGIKTLNLDMALQAIHTHVEYSRLNAIRNFMPDTDVE